MYFLNEAVSKI